jgi:hypothetical protein
VGAQGIEQLSPILLHSSISGHARRTIKPGITVIESKRKEKNSVRLVMYPIEVRSKAVRARSRHA